MMTPRIRLAGILARWALFERKRPPEAASRLPMTCWWTDCDINRHMNNSRYLALMDLGRWHFTLVSGLWRELARRRWYPVAVRVEIDFKKSIRPGERFVLETRLEKVGTKSSTVLQQFWLGEQLAAEARVIVLFLHKGQSQEVGPLLSQLPGVAPQPGPAHADVAP